MSVYSAAELSELATQLSTIEDWLRQDCLARHAEDMADVVHKAWQVMEDTCDEQAASEARIVRES